jgi:hypothetical protein
MREELDAKLCEKYPLLFKNRNAPMTQTCMCWGFCCGDGWYDLIDTLCGLLTNRYNQAKDRYDYLVEAGVGGVLYGTKLVTQEMIDEAKTKMDEQAALVPTVSQVKEKFGGLRFYIDGGTDEHYNYITFAESMSYRICEVCGSKGTYYPFGWHHVACDEHASEEDKQNLKEHHEELDA